MDVLLVMSVTLIMLWIVSICDNIKNGKGKR